MLSRDTLLITSRVLRFTYHGPLFHFLQIALYKLRGLAKLLISNEDLCVTYFPSLPLW